MDITFDFHHDGGGPPDQIEMLGVNESQHDLLQGVINDEYPDPNEILMLTYWTEGQYRGRGMFRVSRIRNIRFH